jgi:hypothetical protein
MSVIQATDPYIWTGKPLQYSFSGGVGLIIGKMHWRFNKSGDLISAEPLKRYVLVVALEHAGYPNPEMALVAKAKPLKPLIRAQKQLRNGD